MRLGGNAASNMPPREGGNLRAEQTKMILKRLVVGALQTNCYLVGCPRTKEGIIIDPGGDAQLILAEVRRLGLKIKYIVNTHGHFDHTMANRAVMEATGAPLAIHAADAPLLTQAPRGLALLLGINPSSPPADIMLHEGDVIAFGTLRLSVLHTPGHSPGGISFLAEGVVFTGDTLFKMGIGRTDLPGGDYQTLMESIRNKLLTLPNETVVYTGHGLPTTIGAEREHNPFLR